MMISPKTYYDLYLKDKSEKQILTVINKLRKEIKQLKSIMEEPNYQPNEKTDESTQLWCNRLYLEQAKQTLQAIGGTYIPTKQELATKEFNDNIPYISKITYHSVAVKEGITIIKIEFDDEFAIINIDYAHNSKEPTRTVLDKENFLDELRNLDLGEWKKHYKLKSNKLFRDGVDWYLDIYYSNGKKELNIKGFDAYPYNYNLLLDLFEYKEDDDLEYTIDENTKNDLIDRMLAKIKELPKETEISTSQLLSLISQKSDYKDGLYIYDDIELENTDMFSLNDELELEAKKHDIILDNTIHADEVLGLPFNIGFKIKDY